jgi:hypothetical protein
MSWTLERALRHRYGSDNEVIAEGSPAAASRMLERLRRQGTRSRCWSRTSGRPI